MCEILVDKGFKFNVGIINIFLLIASTGGVWVFDYSKPLNLSCIYVVFMSLAILQKRDISVKSFYAIISLSLVSAVLIAHYLVLSASSSIEPSNYVNLCIRLMYVVLLYIYLDTAQIDLIKCFKWVLTAIFVHSIINFVFLQFVIPHELLRPYGKADTPTQTFLYVFYFWQTIRVMNFPFIRSQGIFWEPGVLQVFLNLLLYIELNMFTNNRLKIVLIVIAILLTFSTAGYSIAAYLLIVYGLKHGHIKLKLKSLVVTVPAVATGVFFLYTNLIDKLSFDNSISLAYRLFDLEKSLDIIKNHTFIGLGFSTEVFPAYQFDSKLLSLSGQYIQSTFTSDAGNTNSILMLYVSFGCVMATIYLITLYNQSIFNKMPVVFFISLIIICFSEPLVTNNMFLFLFISGCVRFLGSTNRRIYNLR